MTRTVRLRKCGEHPDCQLQSVDDGPFEHTPKNRPLQERFQAPDSDRLKLELVERIAKAQELEHELSQQRAQAGEMIDRLEFEAAGLPEMSKLQERLTKGITESGQLARLLKEQHAKAQELISRVQSGTEGLPQVIALQAETAKTGERLAEGQLVLEALSLRLSHMTDNASRILSEVDDRVREIRNAESRIDSTLSNANESLSHVTERIARVEDILVGLEERRGQFNRVEELFSAVNELRNLLKVETETWSKKAVRLEADVKHEREERLDAHAKVQRQLQGLAERIPDA